jgi:molybdopterin/thiamine biosynthesis adenylyltransferase
MSEMIDLSEGRYDRFNQIAWWSQDRLRRARVLVAGVGALGNEIIKNLALLGVGNIVIVDFDRVEQSNLSRSVLFRTEDDGQPKAAVAARRAREINPNLRVLPIEGDLQWDVGLGLIRRMDVVLGGLDSVGARVAVNQMCWRVGVPFIDGGLADMSGMMRVFVPPDDACFECTLSEDDYRQMSRRYSCQGLAREGIVEGGVPTTPTIASIVGAWQAQEALKWLHGQPIARSQGVSYNGSAHTFFVVRFSRRADCIAHDRYGDILALPEATVGMAAHALLDLLQTTVGAKVTVSLEREVVYALSCPVCRSNTSLLQPRHRLEYFQTLCPACGAERSLHMTHRLDRRVVFDQARLRDLGIPRLHILQARDADQRIYTFELSGDAAQGPLAAFLEGEDTL